MENDENSSTVRRKIKKAILRKVKKRTHTKNNTVYITQLLLPSMELHYYHLPNQIVKKTYECNRN